MKPITYIIALSLLSIHCTLYPLQQKLLKTRSILLNMKLARYLSTSSFYQTPTEFGEIINGKKVKTHDIKILSEEEYIKFIELLKTPYAIEFKEKISTHFYSLENCINKKAFFSFLDSNLGKIDLLLEKHQYSQINNFINQFFNKKQEELLLEKRTLSIKTNVHQAMMKRFGNQYQELSESESSSYAPTLLDIEQQIKNIEIYQIHLHKFMQLLQNNYQQKITSEQAELQRQQEIIAEEKRTEESKWSYKILHFITSTQVWKNITNKIDDSINPDRILSPLEQLHKRTEDAQKRKNKQIERDRNDAY